MRSLVLFVFVIVAAGVFVAQYADRAIVNYANRTTTTGAMTTSSSEGTRSASQQASRQAPPPQAAPRQPARPALPEVVTLSPATRTVTLKDDGQGHFKTDARVDGRRVEFLVDTGATAVVLRSSTAAQLGIRPSRNEYTVKVITANGETRAAQVQLNTVEVGDITVRDVRALVQQDDVLAVNLLGMTFLSRIRWTHDRGRLVLEQ